MLSSHDICLINLTSTNEYNVLGLLTRVLLRVGGGMDAIYALKKYAFEGSLGVSL